MYQNNQVIGRLGGDVEMRFTPQGKAVAKFSVAVDTGYGDKKETLWYKITAWEKLAEVCNEHLSKGKLVFIEGRLTQPGAWIKDEKAQSSIELTANVVKFLSDKE